jgi:hypothetical protein
MNIVYLVFDVLQLAVLVFIWRELIDFRIWLTDKD